MTSHLVGNARCELKIAKGTKVKPGKGNPSKYSVAFVCTAVQTDLIGLIGTSVGFRS